jgi:Fic family protein
MEKVLIRSEVTNSLWIRYQRTDEYLKKGFNEGIPANFPLITKLEEKGLENLLNKFANNLHNDPSPIDTLLNRSRLDWLNDWNKMHETLFGEILIDCGMIRNRAVYIHDPYDEDFFKIPKTFGEITAELEKLINQIYDFLYRIKEKELTERIAIAREIAKIHFQFIRIHPYLDGNGRIGRLLIDELSVTANMTPIMGGYPRNDQIRKEAYQKTIRDCVTDPECDTLTSWILSYIKETEKNIA